MREEGAPRRPSAREHARTSPSSTEGATAGLSSAASRPKRLSDSSQSSPAAHWTAKQCQTLQEARRLRARGGKGTPRC